MKTHAVSADRVVNIDEMSCRLLLVLQGSAEEATTFTIAFSMDRAPLDMLVQTVHAGKTEAVLPEQPWPERTHHVTSENGWSTTATILQFAATLDNVLHPNKEGQAWILLWGMASIHPSEATLTASVPHVVLAFLPPRSTSYLQPCDVAVFRSFKSCIQVQASATLARSVLDGSFDDLIMNKACCQSSAGAFRAVTDLCDKNQAWTTGSRLRAHSGDFRDAVTEAAALHSRDDLFSKHIEPEPTPEDPVDWPMAEASDDEEEAPMPDAPPELKIIDTCRRLQRLHARCRTWSAASLCACCTALGHAESFKKMHNHHHITSSHC